MRGSRGTPRGRAEAHGDDVGPPLVIWRSNSMRKSVLIVAMAALALLGFSNSQAYAQTSTQNVTMAAQNNSCENGTVTITAVGDTSVMVSVNLSNGTAEPQPAHIHKGNCVNLDPKPLYPLNNVVNGKSETTVNVSWADLMKGEYAVNVHKSATEVSTYVSCGNIASMMAGGGSPGGST